MAVQDFISAGNGGNLTPEQVNIAFRDAYGIDAPPKLLDWFAGHESGSGDAFYRRVQSGVFTPDIAKQYPDYLEQSKIAKVTQQQLEQAKAAYAPIIPTLEASKTSLQARYDAILSDLTNRETTDTNAVQKNVAAEFAKRGITPGSDIYNKELSAQLNPINAQYGTQRATQQAQLGTDLNAIDRAIADMRAGKPDVTIPEANKLYPNVSTNAQNTLSYETIGLPQSQEGIRSSQVNNQSIAQQYQDLNALIKQLNS